MNKTIRKNHLLSTATINHSIRQKRWKRLFSKLFTSGVWRSRNYRVHDWLSGPQQGTNIVRSQSSLGYRMPALLRTVPRLELLEDRWLLATFTVDTELDVVSPTDGDLSLREAIELANINSGPDNVVFDPSLSGISFPLTGGELEITDDLVIDGSGIGHAEIDAFGASRIFNITATSGDFTFDSLFLGGGATTDSGNAGSGAAIRSGSTGLLTVSNSDLFSNNTLGNGATGGAIFSAGPLVISDSFITGNSTFGAGAQGGGIYSYSSINLTGSTVSLNTTDGYFSGGGGLFASSTLNIDDSFVYSNSTSGNSAYGGGAATRGNVTVINSTISGNFTSGNIGAGYSASGGGIYAEGSIEVTSSSISGNSTYGNDAQGGGLKAKGEVTISGSSISGNSTFGNNSPGGGVSAEGPIFVFGGDGGSTISGNYTEGDNSPGGGLHVSGSVTISGGSGGTIISENSTYGNNSSGGAVYLEAGAYSNADISNSTIADNSTHGVNSTGGGLHGTGDLTITESTISGNSTTGNNSSGGGLYVGGDLLIDGTVDVIQNSTFGLNAPGGGIGSGGSITITSTSSRIFSVSDNFTVGDNSPGGGLHLNGIDGTISADASGGGSGGTISITNNSTFGPFSPGGGLSAGDSLMIDARGNSGDGGSITLDSNSTIGIESPGGGLHVSGDLSVDASSAGLGNGGNISISNNSTFDLFSPGGGAHVGGSLSLVADGVESGNGGTVTVSSNSTSGDDSAGGGLFTSGDFSITARGGSLAGNGGNITINNNRSLSVSSPGGGAHVGGSHFIDASGNVGNGGTINVTSNSTEGAFSEGGGLFIENDFISANSPSNASNGGTISITVNSTLTIDAPGGGVFVGGNVNLTNTNIIGNSTSDAGSSGGGLHSRGDLTITDSLILDNSTTGDNSYGGGIFNSGGTVNISTTTISENTTSGIESEGGGLWNSSTGSLTISGSTITLNTTTGSNYSRGGGIFNESSSVTITNTTISDNSSAGNYSEGGGLWNSSGGTITITGSTITGNMADASNGAAGGGIFSDNDVNVSDSTISGNSVNSFSSSGGGIFTFGSLNLSDNSSISGNTSSGYFTSGGGLWSSGNVSITDNSNVSDNSTSARFSSGGGISSFGDVTITDGTISGNTNYGKYESAGGGIFNSGGTITITGTTISGNSTDSDYPSTGGGIYNSGGTVNLTDSTISDNSATSVNQDAEGGGLWNSSSGTLTIDNSTFSGNTALGNFSRGGALHNSDNELLILNSTFTNNDTSGTTTGSGGAIWAENPVNIVSILNSIIADNDSTGNNNPDLRVSGGLFVDHSLIGDNSGTSLPEAQTFGIDGNLIGGPIGGTINPFLGPLVDNGGPTLTHALLPGSPAIDSGADTFRSTASSIVGDWDGDGTDDLGLYNDGFFYLDTTGNGVWDMVAGGDTFRDFGLPGIQPTAKPIIGDWDGDGDDDLGLFNNGFFYLDTTQNGIWDTVAGGDTFRDFGLTSIQSVAQPIVGDWDGDGVDDLGLYNDRFFYLDTTGNGAWDMVAGGDTFRDLGLDIIRATARPVVGDWDGDGDDDLGLYNDGFFYLDTTSNGIWDTVAGGDTFRDFGLSTLRSVARPVIGDWDGDGNDDLGLYNDGFFYLDTTGNDAWDAVAGGDTFRDFGLDPANRPFDQRGEPFNRVIDGNKDGTSTIDMGAFEAFPLADLIVDDVSTSEGDSGTTNFTFTVTRTHNHDEISFSVITVDDTATSGVDFDDLNTSVTLPSGGSLSQEFTVSVSGDETVELDEIFMVELLNPIAVDIFDNQGEGTILNDDSATISIDDVALDEGDSGPTLFTFTVTLDAEVDTNLFVSYETNDGTASTAGNDYQDNDSSLSFSGNAGEMQTITVTVDSDATVELDESFMVNLLTLDTNGRDVTFDDDEGTGTILNDDRATISIDDVTLEEGPGGTSTLFTFTVTLDAEVDVPLSVDFTTNNDTAATSGNDYEATSGTVMFDGNATETESISVTVFQDSLGELDETFFVDLSNILAGGRDISFANDQGLGTILNDDQFINVEFDASGNLIIVDNFDGGRDNEIKIEFQAPDLIVISDPLNPIGTEISGASGQGTNELQIPLSSFSDINTAGIIINTLDGNDSLTVDTSIHSAGLGVNPLIQYDGGAPTTAPGDILILTGSASTIDYTADNPNSGGINIDSTNTLITYTGLEPVINFIPVTDSTLTYLGGNDQITIDDDGTSDDGFITIDSNLSESVTLISPTDTLTINAGDGDDVIDLISLDSDAGLPFAATLTIDGGDGNDSLQFATPGATAPAGLTVSDLTITGDGNFNGPVFVQSNAVVSPGESGSPGILSSEDLTMASGSIFEIIIDDSAGPGQPEGHDQYAVSGSVSLGGATLNASLLTFTTSSGVTFVILDNDGSDPINGTFDSLAEGDSLLISGESFFITYIYDADTGTQGTGNDIALFVNRPPVAIDDFITTDEDSPLVGNVLDANPSTSDSDPDGDILTVTELNGNSALIDVATNLPSGSLLTLNNDGSFTYDPNGQFESILFDALETFTYTVDDGFGGSDSASVTINITPVNDTPLIFAPSSLIAVENTDLLVRTQPSQPIDHVGVVISDIDNPQVGEQVRVSLSVNHGVLSVDTAGLLLTFLQGNGSEDSSLSFLGNISTVNAALSGLTYRGNDEFFGNDTLTVTVNDLGNTGSGGSLSDSTTIDITVLEDNGQPRIVSQSIELDEDGSVAASLQGSDDEGSPLSFRIVDGPAHGTLSGDAPNLIYTPDENYNGPDGFSFVANDGEQDSLPGTVEITINPENDQPSLIGLPDVLLLEGSIDQSIDLDSFFSDVETLAADADFAVEDAPAGVSAIIDPVTHVLLLSSDGFLDTGEVTISVTDTGDGTSPVLSDSATLNLTVTPLSFQVAQFTQTASGFNASFNGMADPGVLNLYLGAADVTVVGMNVGSVLGNLVLSDDSRTLSFVKTGGPLKADTYQVTIVSGLEAIHEVTGDLLDGNADGMSGDDFTTIITVTESDAPRLSLPDFARGPGQSVNVPATGSGLPVSISSATGITSVDFSLHFNPEQLNISAVSLGTSLPADWSVVSNVEILGESGVLNVTAFGVTPLSESNVDLINLGADVPESASYTKAQVISFSDIIVGNDAGFLDADSEEAIHLASFFGDTDGDGGYTGFDSSLIAQFVVGLSDGFASNASVDALIVGNVTGSGDLSGLDAAWIAQKSVGLDRPEIPDLPIQLPTPAIEAIDLFFASEPEENKLSGSDDDWNSAVDEALTDGLL